MGSGGSPSVAPQAMQYVLYHLQEICVGVVKGLRVWPYSKPRVKQIFHGYYVYSHIVMRDGAHPARGPMLPRLVPCYKGWTMCRM